MNFWDKSGGWLLNDKLLNTNINKKKINEKHSS